MSHRKPPTDAQLAEAVQEYALARAVHVNAKKAFRECECEQYEPAERPDFASGYPGFDGTPRCFERRDELDALPADACAECQRAEPLLARARDARDRRRRLLARLERMAAHRIVASITNPTPRPRAAKESP